ncbi:MAG TPA: hypothetical protein VHK63_01880 [Candidatus Limnocylindria bacterium]|nr:hypothetical protein [Candidatus Limnocylindria bacterium]
MARKKSTEPDPNKLVRESAGAYRTDDERFEARSSGVGWMLLDNESRDDFGQPLTRGPFPTLDAVREAIPEARRSTIKPVKPAKAVKPAKRR